MSHFEFFNDTGKDVKVRLDMQALPTRGEQQTKIPHGKIGEFLLPLGSHPWVKMWERNGEITLYVSNSFDQREQEAKKANDKHKSYQVMWEELYKTVSYFSNKEDVQEILKEMDRLERLLLKGGN